MKKIINYIKLIPHNHTKVVNYKQKPYPGYSIDIDFLDDYYMKQRDAAFRGVPLKGKLRMKIDNIIWNTIVASFLFSVLLLVKHTLDWIYKYFHK